MTNGVEERITAAAARQHGVVTRAQLREAGLPDRAVSRRVASGTLHRLHQGVFRVGPLVAQYAREAAAVLACGAGARASHRSAAWLLAVGPRPGDASPVEVTVPGSRVVRRPGIRAYRAGYLEAERDGPDRDRGSGHGSSRRGPGDLGGTEHAARAAANETATAHGIPVTSPGRTLIDLAAVLAAGELERALARAERSGLVTLDEIARLAARHRQRPGIATLGALIAQDAGPTFTRSELENLFAEAVRLYGLPRPRFNVRVAGYEMDCWFHAERLAVELDGRAYHRSWRSQANDRRRDGDLAARGIQVYRITWNDLIRAPERTMTGLARALAVRALALPAPAAPTPAAARDG